tara:strand:+ start:11483 stop:12337 length:855 start_codon:yes stop_codon:yes gene_type:complete
MSEVKKWKNIIENAMKVAENDIEDVNHTDHEVSMAKSQLLSSVKSAVRIAKHLKDLSETEGLEGWVASKMTLAEEYLQTVADYMDGEKIQEGYKVLPQIDREKYQSRDGLEGPFSTLSGKVVYYDPKEGKYYDPDTDMYMSYEEFKSLDNDYAGMKTEDKTKIDEGYEGVIIHALGQKGIRGFFNKGTLYIEDDADMEEVEEIVNDTVQVAPDIKPDSEYYQMEGIDKSEPLTEEQFDEAAGEKDACYHKVKSRYKVWPSAYASGALVKCRKVGASNWGNSKKK